MTPPSPTAPPVVIVRVGRRHLVGHLGHHQLYGAATSVELFSARALIRWPDALGLDGLSVAAQDVASDDDSLRLGVAVPRRWARDPEAVWWTTAAAGAALLAHPVHVPESPARPLVDLTPIEGTLALSLVDVAVTNCTGAVLDPRKSRPGRAIPTPAEVFRP